MKKNTAFRRCVVIGWTCVGLSALLLALKLLGPAVDFAALPWQWVIAPVAVPAGIILCTVLAMVVLFYKPKQKPRYGKH